MLNYNLANLYNCSVCTESESHYLVKELEFLDSEDLKILINKKIFLDFKITYLKPMLGKTDIINKFEENIIKVIKGIDLGTNKKIKGLNNYFMMKIDYLPYSKIVIYSLEKNEIIVRRTTHDYCERTSEFVDELKQIEIDYPNILTTTKSIDYILRNNCSLVRFGDGELNLCCGINIGFQNASKLLQDRLIEILCHGSDDKVLLAIPEFNSKYNNVLYNEQVSFWEYYWYKMYSKLGSLFIHKVYGNTDISRNTVFYENNIEYIKKIWDKRDVVFVFGDMGRFEIKSELFDNILSFKIIKVPPVNAFSKYNEILNSCLAYNKDKLFLIAAGPTATVLAFDLMKNGYQALDIGHIPNCYDQYLGKISSPESLPYIGDTEQ